MQPHQVNCVSDQPVCCFLRLSAQSCSLFKNLCKMFFFGQKLRCLLTHAVITHVAFLLGFRHLRLCLSQVLHHFIINGDRRNIRFREIAVILCIFFGTHGIGLAAVIVPPSGFLHDGFSEFQCVDLPLCFKGDGTLDGLKGVDVFHLCTGAKSFRASLSDGKIDVSTHRAFFHLTVGHAQIFESGFQLYQISNDLFTATKIRFRDNFQKRHAATVVVWVGHISERRMHQLACVFFHMDLVNANVLFFA